jgi:peroxiredoxin
MNRKTLLLGLLLLVPPGMADLSAQVSIRARTMGDPRPGREAPAFTLPYATADGPGPAPFEIRAELGRVVVLAFCAGATDRAAQALLGAFASRADSLFPGDLAVAAILPVSTDSLVGMAARMRLPYKLLADVDGDVRRLFGIEKGGTAVYVVGLDGRIVWRELDFNPFLARGYAEIEAAIAKGRQF